MFTATLIAADQLGAGDISTAADMIRETGSAVTGIERLEPGKAADLHFDGDSSTVREALEHAFRKTDVIVQKTAHRLRKFLIADMDSTMITVECIDELADFAGLKAEIAEVTERAMRGELDFEAALRSRVGLLKGLPEATIEQCLAERVHIMPGAKQLVQTLKALGGVSVLISGGFTRFAGPVAREIGFDKFIANTLEIEDGKLSGGVTFPIVDAQTKLQTLRAEVNERGLSQDNSIAIGDGANDIPMIQEAGLGVAYHAKPKTAAAARARIDHGDLSALLYAMGIPRAQWID